MYARYRQKAGMAITRRQINIPKRLMGKLISRCQWTAWLYWWEAALSLRRRSHSCILTAYNVCKPTVQCSILIPFTTIQYSHIFFPIIPSVRHVNSDRLSGNLSDIWAAVLADCCSFSVQSSAPYLRSHSTEFCPSPLKYVLSFCSAPSTAPLTCSVSESWKCRQIIHHCVLLLRFLSRSAE